MFGQPQQVQPSQFNPYSPQQNIDIGRVIRMAQQMGIPTDEAQRVAQLYVKNQPPDPQKAAIQAALFGPEAARGKMI